MTRRCSRDCHKALSKAGPTSPGTPASPFPSVSLPCWPSRPCWLACSAFLLSGPPCRQATRALRPNGPTGCEPITPGWWRSASRSSTTRPRRRQRGPTEEPQQGAGDGRRHPTTTTGPPPARVPATSRGLTTAALPTTTTTTHPPGLPAPSPVPLVVQPALAGRGGLASYGATGPRGARDVRGPVPG